jgi:hypothetical protein
MERARQQDEALRARGFVPDRPWQSLFERRLAVGCDLDGTLFRRRVGPDERGPYEFTRVGEDLVNEMTAHTLDLYRADGFAIVLMSGRPTEFRAETVAALEANVLEYDDLFTRPLASSSIPDEAMKEQMFLQEVDPWYDIRLMLDDRKKVVDMWRRLDRFPCWAVADGDF